MVNRDGFKYSLLEEDELEGETEGTLTEGEKKKDETVEGTGEETTEEEPTM